MREVLSVPAVRFELSVRGVSALNLLRTEPALALRSWVHGVAFDGAPATGARAIECSAIAAVFDATTRQTSLFNLSSAANRGGSAFNSSEDFLTALGWGPAVGKAAGDASLTGGAVAAGAAGVNVNAARRRLGLGDVASGGGTQSTGTSLALQLDGEFAKSPPADTPESNATQLVVCVVNILTTSKSEATAVLRRIVDNSAAAMTALEASLRESLGEAAARRAGAVNASLTLYGASNATASQENNRTSASSLLATSDTSSARIVDLTLTRSFWGIFLDWLVRNVIRVLAGTSAIIVFILFLTFYRQFAGSLKARAQERAQDASKQVVESLAKRLRFSVIKAKFRKALRRVTAFVALLIQTRAMRETEEADGGAATSKPAATFMGARREGGVERRVERADSRVVTDASRSDLEASAVTSSDESEHEEGLDSLSHFVEQSQVIETVVQEGTPEQATPPIVGHARRADVFRAANAVRFAVRARIDPRKPLEGIRERMLALKQRFHLEDGDGVRGESAE